MFFEIEGINKIFEGYADVEHKIPFVYYLRNKQTDLLYYGTKHTNNCHESVFGDITCILDTYKPDVVMVEGVPQLNSKNRMKFLEQLADIKANKICILGENVYTVYESYLRGIDIFCIDPPLGNEMAIINNYGFCWDYIFLYYMCCYIYQYKEKKQNRTVEVILENGIKYFNSAGLKDGSSYSKQDFVDLFYRIFNTRNYEEKSIHFYRCLLDPVPRNENKDFEKYRFNEISRIRNYFRDSYIIEEIQQKMSNYKKLFIVFGATHAYMHKKELEYIMKRDEKKE